MLIKGCLNGAWPPGQHPALPLTPAELAAAGRAAVAAGAGALHFHPRRADGAQSLGADDVANAVLAVRDACPGVPIGVTTLFEIAPDPRQRADLVASWTVRPDFASVNFAEPGAAELCAALESIGVGIEAGLASADDAALLLRLGLADRCVRVLLEPDEPDPAAALATVAAVEALLDQAGTPVPRLLHGVGPAAWPLLETALGRGYDTRIGLEDTLALPDNTPAQDNAQLVALAVARAARAQGTRSTRFPLGTRGQAVAAWSVSYPDPLVARAGDVVAAGKRDDEWPFVWCVASSGKAGWVPERFLEQRGNQVALLVDYTAQELPLAVGETIGLHYEEGGWFWATNAAGTSGWVPARNVVVPQQNQ